MGKYWASGIISSEANPLSAHTTFRRKKSACPPLTELQTPHSWKLYRPVLPDLRVPLLGAFPWGGRNSEQEFSKCEISGEYCLGVEQRAYPSTENVEWDWEFSPHLWYGPLLGGSIGRPIGRFFWPMPCSPELLHSLLQRENWMFPSWASNKSPWRNKFWRLLQRLKGLALSGGTLPSLSALQAAQPTK